MADSFTTNPGSGGATFASDDISSVHYPRIKLIHGADGVNAGDVATANPLPTSNIGIATSGLSIYRSLDVDETEEEVKATAGSIYGVWGANLTIATKYLKFYDATAGAVTVGTTTPILTLPIPGNTSDSVAFNFNAGGLGIAFANALCVAATTGLADNDTGAPSANAIVCNILYK